jgi:Alcohol dehydrogenase GroES-like domain
MGSSPSKGKAFIQQDSTETRKQMTGTYAAVEVSTPGVLRVVERRVSEPQAGQVRIRVEACGICHTDAATVTGAYPGCRVFPGMKSLAALKLWAQAWLGGKSVNVLVSA